MALISVRQYGEGFNNPPTRYIAYSGPNHLNPESHIAFSGNAYNQMIGMLREHFCLTRAQVEGAMCSAALVIANSSELRSCAEVRDFIELAAFECIGMVNSDIEA
jgi:hypothetical protein